MCNLLVDHITVAVDEQFLGHVAGEALHEKVRDGPDGEAEGQGSPLLEDESQIREPTEAATHSLGHLAGHSPDYSSGNARNTDPAASGGLGRSVLQSGTEARTGAGVGAGPDAGAVASGSARGALVEARLEVDAWRYLDAIDRVTYLRIADENPRHDIHHFENPDGNVIQLMYLEVIFRTKHAPHCMWYHLGSIGFLYVYFELDFCRFCLHIFYIAWNSFCLISHDEFYLIPIDADADSGAGWSDDVFIFLSSRFLCSARGYFCTQ